MAQEEFYQDTVDKTPYQLFWWLFVVGLVTFLAGAYLLWNLGVSLKHNRYNEPSTWWDRIRGVKVDTTKIQNRTNSVIDSAKNQAIDAANQAAKDATNSIVDSAKEQVVDTTKQEIENIKLKVNP